MLAKDIKITQSDVDNIAIKLDEFSSVLSRPEQDVMLGMFLLARQALQKLPTSSTPRQPEVAPKLGESFRTALARGIGHTFHVEGDESEDADGWNIKIVIGCKAYSSGGEQME